MKHKAIIFVFLGSVILVSLTILGGAASAASPGWEEKQQEKKWQAVEIQAPGTNDFVFKGFLTTNGKIRIDDSSAEVTKVMHVDSENNFGGKGPSRWKRWCERNKGKILQRRRKINPLSVKITDLPVLDGDNRGWSIKGQYKQRKLENQFQLEHMQVGAELELSPNASTLLESRYEPETYRAKIQQKLATMWRVGIAKGEANLDLTGLDDLACDIAHGRATITLSVGLPHMSAKMSGHSLVKSRDIESIDQQATEYELPDFEGDQAAIAKVASLTMSVAEYMMGKSVNFPGQVATRRVIQLTTGLTPHLIDLERAEWVQPSLQGYGEIEKKLSTYKYTDNSQSWISMTLQGER